MNIFLLFLFLSFSLQAAELQEAWAQAGKCYYNYAFKDALSTYISLSEKNSAVWENMGNCAYYLDDFPYAILYWRKAQQEADSKRSLYLQERIDQVFGQLGIENKMTWGKYVERLPYWFLPLLFLLSWSGLLFWGPFYYRRNKYFSVAILAAITFFCGILSNMQYSYIGQKKGVAISSHTALHTGTDDKLPIITQLKAGQEVKVKDRQQDWYQASTGSYTGWVHKDMIEVV